VLLVLEPATLALDVDLTVELVEALDNVRVVVEPLARTLIGGLDRAELLDNLCSSAGEPVGFGLCVSVPGSEGDVEGLLGASLGPDGPTVLDVGQCRVGGLRDGSGVLGPGFRQGSAGQPGRGAGPVALAGV
jgi:hypothetical protein